ncbi:hypothetical protein [uncultured Maricaulis sp.]|uniref:hypothetical protein n=1 Tax=uncultured Maricaulis sp. TaxID=174710 RepID=UPI0030D907A6|tara:strand:+ start:24076 stop:24447 length:372 start_codon:yes stop_codon:yes gene_type:complete
MITRVFAAALLSAAALSASASAQSVFSEVTIYNGSGAAITAVYAGPSSQPEWGYNTLDVAQVWPGDDLIVTMNNDTGECLYDLRYDFADGDVYEEYQVDICAINGQRFEINRDSGMKGEGDTK